MPARTAITDEWVSAAGREDTVPFSVEAAWGTLSGVIVRPGKRRGFLGRAARQAPAAQVAFVVPRWPGLGEGGRESLLDDALCAGLLRGGVSVARADAVEFAGEPDVAGWLDAVADGFGAATADSQRPGLAGSWFAGTAAALLSSRIPSLGFLVCACAPSAEVMSRRTPENEDDPAWESSPQLRLADALSALAPLEAVTVNARPSLFVQGAGEGPIGADHLDAWCAALAATGRPAESVEVAFADALLAPVAGPGGEAPDPDAPLDLLAAAVAAWTRRTVTRPAARRGR